MTVSPRRRAAAPGAPGAAAFDVLLPTSSASAGRAPRAAGRVDRGRLLRVALRPAAVVGLGDRPVHARRRLRVHARQLPAHHRDAGLPRRRLAHDPDGCARDGRGRDHRVPDRVLHGARRVAADAQHPRRRRPDAAVGELPRQGVRVAHDPVRRRDHQLGARAARASHSTGTRPSGSGSSSRTCGCRSWSCRSTRGSSGYPSSLLEASADLGGRSLSRRSRA